jgi:hypothetical protein
VTVTVILDRSAERTENSAQSKRPVGGSSMTPHAEPIVIPPLEAFLTHPHFATSDIWVWPLFFVLVASWFKTLYGAAGLDGRDINILVLARATNSLTLWFGIVALSRAVHRATADVLVAGVWTGVFVILTGGAYTLLMRRSRLDAMHRKVKEDMDAFGERERARAEARKEAKARGEVLKDEHGRTVHDYIQPDGAAAAARHVSVLMRPDLFADPKPEPTGEPRPQPEKPVDF